MAEMAAVAAEAQARSAPGSRSCTASARGVGEPASSSRPPRDTGPRPSGLPLRHRRAQGARADLEADPLRRRRGTWIDGCAARQPAPREEEHDRDNARGSTSTAPRRTGAPRHRRPLAIEEELWTDDSGEDYSGWYCVRTDPWTCPAAGCTFVADFLTAAHLIIVWPERTTPRCCATPRPRATWAATRAPTSTSPPSGPPARTTSGRRRATRCTPSGRTSAATSTRRREGAARPSGPARPRPPARSPRPGGPAPRRPSTTPAWAPTASARCASA